MFVQAIGRVGSSVDISVDAWPDMGWVSSFRPLMLTTTGRSYAGQRSNKVYELAFFSAETL